MQDDAAARRRVGDALLTARNVGARLAPKRGIVEVRYSTVAAVGTGTVTLLDEGVEVPDVQHLSAYQPVVGDMVRVEIQGTQWTVTDSVYSAARSPRGAWRELQGTASVTVTASTQGVGSAVTFPSGFFTVTPRIYQSIQGAGVSTLTHLRMTGAPSAGGFTPVVNVATALTATFTVAWLAVQMTPTSADG